jgi:hypothetical protein
MRMPSLQDRDSFRPAPKGTSRGHGNPNDFSRRLASRLRLDNLATDLPDPATVVRALVEMKPS